MISRRYREYIILNYLVRIMTIFTCEREYEAMLTCIYVAWASKLGHNNLQLMMEPIGQYDLLNEYVHVDMDECKADSVVDAINTKISPYFYREMLYSAMYYEEDVLDNIYRMLLLGFKYGDSALDMSQYEVVNRNRQIRKAYETEICRFKEFLRFHEVKKSVYVAHIEPRSRVVTALGPIFMDRMPSENWMIVDDVHMEAVIHPRDEAFYIRRFDENELNNLIATERSNDEYTDMWKVFFDSISIKERYNPSCQQSHMPLWTRKHVVEFH